MATEWSLENWRHGQVSAERMCVQLLSIEGFKELDPQCPLGGRDGRKDILCAKDASNYVAAAYFPTEKVERFKEIKDKFLHDLEGVQINKVDGIVFLTGQKMTPAERDDLSAAAAKIGTKAILYHQERMVGLLDSPLGFAARLQFLGLPMRSEEQMSFVLALRGQDRGIQDALGRMEKKMDEFASRSKEQPQAPPPAPADESCPSARTESKIITVDPRPGRADFQTISEAILQASGGERILVRPGTYKEGLVLNKPLEILGDGPREEIIVEFDAANTLLVSTEIGRVGNLTLRQTGSTHWRCVMINQGRLELEECDITSQDVICVGVEGGAAPLIRRCIIHSSKRCGVYVSDNAKGTFEDNDIFGHSQFGVEIWTGADPVLRRNRIHHCQEHVVGIFDGKGNLEDNDLFANQASGIVISRGGAPVIRRNRIHDNQNSGVLCGTDGSGTLEDNDIFANQGAGISIAGSGAPVLRHNRIHDNQSAGVMCTHSNGTLEDNEIFVNGDFGVIIINGANPSLHRNRIYASKLGVVVSHGGQGTLEDNSIFANAQGGVAVFSAGAPSVRRNRINRNGIVAVYVVDAGGVFEENDLRDNNRGAWHIKPGSSDRTVRKGNIEK